MTIGVLYVGDYKLDEESLILGQVRTVRINADFEFVEKLPQDSLWILRSRRLALPSYCRLWETVDSFGARLCTQPLSYGIISSLRAPSLALSGQIPPMIVLDSNVQAVDLMAAVQKRGLQFPVFVRSEVESAAKYVGVEGCTISDLDLAQVNVVLTNLRSHVSDFREIGVKEVWPVRLLGSTTMTMEYRAVGCAGSLIAFDHRSVGPLPAPGPYIERFAADAFARLAEIGADGLHVVDVALSNDERRPFAVEWKDLASSSLAMPKEVLPAVADACGSRLWEID